MKKPPYIDTSALAKWYLSEPRSEDFEAFLQQQGSGAISRLTVLEFRCLLARRQRCREFDSRLARKVFATFESDIRKGFLTVHPLEDQHAQSAVSLIGRLRGHPLRTLDALHLAIALDLKSAKIATADRVLGDAAAALGIEVARFH